MGRLAISPGAESIIVDLSKGTSSAAKTAYNFALTGTLSRTNATLTTYIVNKPIINGAVDYTAKIDASNLLAGGHRVGFAALLPYPDDNWNYQLYSDIKIDEDGDLDALYINSFFGVGKTFQTVSGDLKVLEVAPLAYGGLGSSNWLIQNHDNPNSNISLFGLYAVAGIVIDNEHPTNGKRIDSDIIINFRQYNDTLEYREPIANF